MNQVRVTESVIADWDMESDSLETALSESIVLGMSPPGCHVPSSLGFGIKECAGVQKLIDLSLKAFALQ